METKEIEDLLKETCKMFDLTPKEFYPWVRKALIGSETGPAIPEILVTLGPEETFKRITEFLSKVKIID